MSHEVLVRGLFVKSELCVCNSGITWVLFLVCQRGVTVLYLTISIHFVYASLFLAGFWLGVVIVHLVLAHVQDSRDSPACLSVVSGKIFIFKSCNFSPNTFFLFLHRCWTVDLSLVGVMESCSNTKLTCLIVEMGRKNCSEIKITVMWLDMVSLGEKFFKTNRFFDTWTEPTFADPWSCGTAFILIFLYVFVCMYVCVCVCVCIYIYIQGVPGGMCQTWEGVPYVKVYWYNPKHLYPKLNGYGDNGQRKVGASCGSKYCNLHSWYVTWQCERPWQWNAVFTVPAWRFAQSAMLRHRRAFSCIVLVTLRTTMTRVRVFL